MTLSYGFFSLKILPVLFPEHFRRQPLISFCPSPPPPSRPHGLHHLLWPALICPACLGAEMLDSGSTPFPLLLKLAPFPRLRCPSVSSPNLKNLPPPTSFFLDVFCLPHLPLLLRHLPPPCFSKNGFPCNT